MRRVAATALLGATSTIWAALPLEGTGTAGWVLAVVAGGCVLAGVLRLLALGPSTTEGASRWAVWPRLLGTARSRRQWAGPESVAVIAVVALETLHQSRPWHTGSLALFVICYLLAVHHAEGPAREASLSGEARLLVASLPLVAAATGVAMATGTGGGATSRWLEIIAALAAITAGALAVPL